MNKTSLEIAKVKNSSYQCSAGILKNTIEL